MSQAGGNSTSGGGGSGITTINGDTGSITGSTVTIYSHNATQNAGSSVLFANSGTTSTLDVTDAIGNTIIGKAAGNASLTSTQNVGIGSAALQALTVVGPQGNGSNVAIGFEALTAGTSANANLAIGAFSLNSLLTGQNNICLGYSSGSAYTSTESSNVCLANHGVIGDHNTLRIGEQGSGREQQDLCFIAGITGATPTSANTPQVVLCDNAGNLTAISSSTSGFVLTSNGSATPSFQANTGGGVTGPGSSTNNAIATWNGTGGTALFSPPSPLVTSGGIMTNPNQPAFQAYLTANATNVTGNGANYTVAFNAVKFDQAGNFNTGLHTFTAPVTGLYMFTGRLYLVITNVLETQCVMFLNATVATYQVTTNSGFAMAGNSVLITPFSEFVPMTAGDTCSLSVEVSGGASNDVIVGGTFPLSTFSGYLVC